MSPLSRGALASILFAGCTGTPTPTPTAVTTTAPVRASTERLVRARPGELVEPAATATASARALVARLAPRWGIAQLPTLEAAGEVGVGGGTIVRLQQTIDGLPIEAGELHVLVRPTGELIAASGTPASAELQRDVPRFTGTANDAVARAIAAVAPRAHALAGSGRSRARQVWHRAGNALVAAWLVEAYLDDGDAVRTVIAASDGRVLSHRSLVERDTPFQYRVWADATPELHPHDSPNADFCPYPHATIQSDYPGRVASSLVAVTGNNHPVGAAAADPWLAATATETVGNNVDAYCDVNSPDGFSSGDFRASITTAGQFDRTYDFTKAPVATTNNQMASIAAMFFTLNWMHDFWYDAGFTEAANNAQVSNYGRGGVEGDPLLGEAQDFSGRDNANMSTPDDGMSPRMQMYVWDGAVQQTLKLGTTVVASGAAAFGPATVATSGTIVQATDGTAPTTDVCEAITNGAQLAGKIALVDRGLCSFQKKAAAVQGAGAIGMILVDNMTSATPPGMPADSTAGAVTIGTMSITMADGAALRAQLANGPVTATLARATDPDLDGGLDATVVAHENGHYVHHRLQQCNTAMCGAMSEGWADFSALLMTTRPGDDFQHGAFPLAQYAAQSFGNAGYFGIRRVPYSIVTTFDPLTFIDMADGQALPTTAPIASTGGGNSEAHNAGEVWATMLFEIYAALQQEVGDFPTARTRMAKDVVAGLLLAPPDSTPTEIRDALITAAGANTPGDDQLFAAAFARRGLGSCAVSPPRDSTDFVGIVESNTLAGNLTLGDVAVGTGTCGATGTLASGQSLALTVPLSNSGFVAVDGITAAITSPTPGLTFDTSQVTIGSLAPGGHHDLAITVHYDAGATKGTPVAGEIDVTTMSSNGCTTTLATTVPLRLDVDDTLDGQTTDHFDTAASTWAATSADTWQHVRKTALDGAWHGDDLGRPSNESLASPPLVVAADQDFTVAFTHKYSFEYSQATAWDAGVVEYSIDGGTSWADVTTLSGVTAGYGPDVITNQAGNTLAGRKGYTHTNASYPGTDAVTIAFGRALAGKTVRLRFLIGTDQASGDAGWDIDDVAVSGITNAPFGAEVPFTGCSAGPSEAGNDSGGMGGSSGGGCCDAGPLAGGHALMAMLVGVGLVRRRRR